MDFGFCTFIERPKDSKAIIMLEFIYKKGTIQRIMGFPLTEILSLGTQEEKEKEFDEIDFDNLVNAPCIFLAPNEKYSDSKFLLKFKLISNEEITNLIKNKRGSYWMKADLNFIRLCKQFDSSIETKLLEERNKRLEEAFPEMKRKETVMTCTCPKCGYVWKETNDAKVHKSSDD